MELPAFVTAAAVRRLLLDPGIEVCLFDVRRGPDGGSDYDGFLAGHLPGAMYVDVDRMLASPPSPSGGRHPLPDAHQFADDLWLHGVAPGRPVVAYDTGGGGYAARLAWMLRVLGHPAGVLSTGLDGFDDDLETGDDGDVVLGDRLVLGDWPDDAIATIDQVAATDGVLVDARAPARYRGEQEPIDRVAGHIPGAVNVPYAGNLSADGTLLDDDTLRDRFTAAGIGADSDVIVYCGSGVTACHDALAMEQVGLGRPRVFVGSWSAWSADPARPIATG